MAWRAHVDLRAHFALVSLARQEGGEVFYPTLQSLLLECPETSQGLHYHFLLKLKSFNYQYVLAH